MRRRLALSALLLAMLALSLGVLHARPSEDATHEAPEGSEGSEGAVDPRPPDASLAHRSLRDALPRPVATDAGASEAPDGTRTASTASADGASSRLADFVPDDPPPAGPALRRLIEDTLASVEAEREPVPRVGGAVVDRLVDAGEVRIVFSMPGMTAMAAGATADATSAGLVERVRWQAFGGLVPDASLRAEGAALRVFPAFGHASARVDARAFLALLRSGATDRIELDAVHRPTLRSSLVVIGADRVQAEGVDGDGFAVAVLDTGVDTGHAMFDGRVAAEACFSLLGDCPNDGYQMVGPGAGAPCPLSGCGHGTLVAGVAVGRQPDDSLVGVAPAAELISIQIFSDIGGDIGAYSSDILAGLQHVLSLSGEHAIASVNLSLGGDTYTSTEACDAAAGSQVAAVDALRSAGIAVVAAAGNDGRIDALASPGCLSNVIGVGATRDDDAIASFSNVSESLALFAPGQSIETSASGGGTRFASGTSMATPHVSGAIAAIREAHPTASVREIENAFALTGTPIPDARNGVVRPRIDVELAIDWLDVTVAPAPDVGSPAPATGSEGSGAGAAATTAGGGGGGACGLVGIEPFLAVGTLRLIRRRGRGLRRPACG